MQCNAMQCNAMQCNAMQRNAMQCNAKITGEIIVKLADVFLIRQSDNMLTLYVLPG